MDFSHWAIGLGLVILLVGCTSPPPATDSTQAIPPPPLNEGFSPGPGPSITFCISEDLEANEECFENVLASCGKATATFWYTSDGEPLNFEVLNLTEEDTCRVRLYIDNNSTSRYAGQTATCVLVRDDEGLFDAYDLTTETCTGEFVASIQRDSSNAAAEPPPLPSPEVKAFFFTVNDSGVLGEQVFVVQKGDAVTFTISVATSNVSFGGAVIRAPAGKARDIDAFIFTTGNLSPGQVGEVSFIADESFSFAVYWPSSDIQKGKMARVEVE